MALAWFRRRRTLLAAGAVLAAAAVALFVRPVGEERPIELALAETRSLEPRLSWAGADRHRPHAVARGDKAPVSHEAISLDALAKLEARGELRGLAAGELLSGETDRAAATLARAPGSADVLSDRAAVALVAGDPTRALALSDGALALTPAHPQAQWNRALALRDLGLERSAAQQLDAVAAHGEPGWADEARTRAAAARAALDASARSERAAEAATLALVQRGTPLPESVVHDQPELARRGFYEALRVAGTRAQVLALQPLAAQLDQPSGAQLLADGARRAASADFQRPAPLAKRYAALLALPPHDAATLAQFAQLADDARRAHEPELLFGALFHGGAATHLDEYSALAEASGDPWLRAQAAHERAQAGAGDAATRAAALALAMQQVQAAHLQLPAIELEIDESALALSQHHLDEAQANAQAAFDRARRVGLPREQSRALAQLAGVARARGATSLAAAYAAEARP